MIAAVLALTSARNPIAFVRLVTLVALGALSACSHIEPKVSIEHPTSARPTPAPITPPTNGSIFQASGHRPLFEDPRARLRGDIITVAIVEKNSASRTSSSTTSKTSDIKAGVAALGALSTKALSNAALGANTANTYAGKGDTSNENAFGGTITVTVIDVLSNGNLVVAGEKQIGINHNLEFIRFAGVVNPVTLQAGNIVESTKIADARLEYTGRGYIDEAQRMGWLSRFFLTASPF